MSKPADINASLPVIITLDRRGDRFLKTLAAGFGQAVHMNANFFDRFGKLSISTNARPGQTAWENFDSIHIENHIQPMTFLHRTSKRQGFR